MAHMTHRQPLDNLFAWGSRTYVMGIVNVTPDSFAGDGIEGDVEAAVALALRFQQEGADILDVGAESTRPGHAPVSASEELARLMPVLEALIPQASVPVSVDTYKSQVARRALEAGVGMVNDVWGLKRDQEIARLAAEHGAFLVLMHNQEGTDYDDLMKDVGSSLRWSAQTAQAAGVPPERIILDPGFGFGKTAEQNLEMLRSLPELRALGYPLLMGTSRKSTIGLVLELPVEERLEGTAATVALSVAYGADVVRVHDVLAMGRVARMTDAVTRGWSRASPPSGRSPGPLSGSHTPA